MSYHHKPAHPGYGRDGKRLPYLTDMTPDQVMHELVGDAVARFDTKLQRYVDGIQMVANARKIPVETVQQEIDDETRSLTGSTATEFWSHMAEG